MMFFIFYTFCASQIFELNNIEEYCQGLIKNINDNIAKHKKENSDCTSCYAIIRKNKEEETQNTIDLTQNIIEKYMTIAANDPISCHKPKSEIFKIGTAVDILKEMFDTNKNNIFAENCIVGRTKDCTVIEKYAKQCENYILLFESCFESKLDKLTLYERIQPVIGQIDNKNYQHVFLCLRFNSASERNKFNEDITKQVNEYMVERKDKKLDFFMLDHIDYNCSNAKKPAKTICGKIIKYQNYLYCIEYSQNSYITYKNYYEKQKIERNVVNFEIKIKNVSDDDLAKLLSKIDCCNVKATTGISMEFIQGNDSKIYHIIQANDNEEQNIQKKVFKRYIAIIEQKKTTCNILYMSSFQEISRKNRNNFTVQLRNINVLDEVLYDILKDYSCFIDFEVINKNISYGMSKLYIKTNFNVAKNEVIDSNNFTFNFGNICEFENTLKMKNDTIDIEYYTFDYKKPAKDNLDNTEIDHIHNFLKLEKYDLKDYSKLLIYITIKSEQDISQKYILIYTKHSIFVEELTTDIIDKFLKLENLCSELATVNPEAPDIVKHLKICNIFNNFNHIEMYDFIFKFDNVVQKLKILLINEILNVENQDTSYFSSFIEKCNKEERDLFVNLRKIETKNEIIYNHPNLDDFFTRANNDDNINSIMLHYRIVSSEICKLLRESDDINDSTDNRKTNNKSDYENTKQELKKFGQNEFGKNKIIILEHIKNNVNKISDIVESIKKFYENENNDMLTEIMKDFNSRL